MTVCCRWVPRSAKGHEDTFPIADQLIALANTGLDGIVLSCVNYHDEMRQWIDKVMPLIEQAGLRKPYRPRTE